DDVGVLVEEFLDLAGVDVLAAADHHVLDPTRDRDITTVVHDRDVPGVHPPVGVDHLRGLLRVVPIAGHHAVPAGAQFAGFAARHDLPGLGVDDLDLQMRARRAGRAG